MNQIRWTGEPKTIQKVPPQNCGMISWTVAKERHAKGILSQRTHRRNDRKMHEKRSKKGSWKPSGGPNLRQVTLKTFQSLLKLATHAKGPGTDAERGAIWDESRDPARFGGVQGRLQRRTCTLKSRSSTPPNDSIAKSSEKVSKTCRKWTNIRRQNRAKTRYCR